MPDSEHAFTNPFSDDPPSELLEWIAEGNEDERIQATGALYLRYSKWLFGCLRKGLRNHDDEFVSDIVLKTIQVAVKNAKKFKNISGDETELANNRFKKWLLVIAKRIYCGVLRKNSPITTMGDDFWNTVNESATAPSQTPPTNPKILVVEKVLSELSKREEDIYRAWLYHCPDVTNTQAKLPRNVIRELCEQFKTTPDNLRTIKSRTKKKIEAKLLEEGINS